MRSKLLMQFCRIGITQLDRLRWGMRTHGAIIPIRNRPRFLYNAPTPKFHRPMFPTRSEVIVLTNNETNTQTNKRR